jgi:hypothetical protein
MGKLVVLWMTLLAAVFACVLQSVAQTTYLRTGPVTVLKSSADCTGRGFNNTALCQLAIVKNCPNDDDLEFLFAINPARGTSKGTIVLLSGFGGTNATEAPDQGNSFVNSYTQAGYTVLQVAWGGEGQNGGIDWERTHSDITIQPSVRNAACRPASLLLWAFNNPAIYSGGGKCVQGFSAGGGAGAYAVSWYGAADAALGYLDKLLFISGPELADIKQAAKLTHRESTTSTLTSASTT